MRRQPSSAPKMGSIPPMKDSVDQMREAPVIYAGRLQDLFYGGQQEVKECLIAMISPFEIIKEIVPDVTLLDEDDAFTQLEVLEEKFRREDSLYEKIIIAAFQQALLEALREWQNVLCFDLQGEALVEALNRARESYEKILRDGAPLQTRDEIAYRLLQESKNPVSLRNERFIHHLTVTVKWLTILALLYAGVQMIKPPPPNPSSKKSPPAVSGKTSPEEHDGVE